MAGPALCVCSCCFSQHLFPAHTEHSTALQDELLTKAAPAPSPCWRQKGTHRHSSSTRNPVLSRDTALPSWGFAQLPPLFPRGCASTSRGCCSASSLLQEPAFIHSGKISSKSRAGCCQAVKSAAAAPGSSNAHPTATLSPHPQTEHCLSTPPPPLRVLFMGAEPALQHYWFFPQGLWPQARISKVGNTTATSSPAPGALQLNPPPPSRRAGGFAAVRGAAVKTPPPDDRILSKHVHSPSAL